MQGANSASQRDEKKQFRQSYVSDNFRFRERSQSSADEIGKLHYGHPLNQKVTRESATTPSRDGPHEYALPLMDENKSENKGDNGLNNFSRVHGGLINDLKGGGTTEPKSNLGPLTEVKKGQLSSNFDNIDGYTTIARVKSELMSANKDGLHLPPVVQPREKTSRGQD